VLGIVSNALQRYGYFRNLQGPEENIFAPGPEILPFFHFLTLIEQPMAAVVAIAIVLPPKSASTAASTYFSSTSFASL